eukprot:TRINITY_DN2753_c0_g1_i1.p1 TRINITY_DN2753_c0_g1~~TRINITY_DN2753_c0_g1_i1.p1  ORF type:complete len:427 (+),score=122.62 TRINITY_DN2753_c0_g1_i1:27-1307(+)
MMAKRSSLGFVLCLGLALLSACALLSQRQAAGRGFVSAPSPSKSTRCLKVARNGVDKALRERITSVKKTGKLTDAMRMVAAAKVRRAQAGVEKARPFSEELSSMIKGLVKKLKNSGLEAELPMLRVPEKVTNIGILVVTSNRGLCGGYNTFAAKKLEARVASLNAQGIEPKILIVGKKGKNKVPARLKKLKYNITGDWFGMPDTITATESSEIADALRNLFLSGEVDKVEVVYGKFYNLIKTMPQLRTVLPLSPTGIEDPEDETFKLTTEDGKMKVEKEKVKSSKAKDLETDVIFDQPPETILNSMLPLYLNSQILSILYDAQASELSSRMTAMKAATDNAEELAKKLNLLYNKKRQAYITNEICEISAGAAALDETGDIEVGTDFDASETIDSIEADFLKEIQDGSLPDEPTGPDFPDFVEGIPA